jgi:beta-galactosidase
LNLPHDWSIEGDFTETNPTGGSGGYLPAGIGWYRKSFALPEWRGKKIVIEFDGVYMNCDVWINGNHLGNHPYGYTSFFHELTPFLVHGEEANVVSVRVDNSDQPNSRWYTGSGIYRHTWLTSCSPIHVVTWGTYVTTPLVTRELSMVQTSTKVANKTGGSRLISVRTKVIDGKGTAVAEQAAAADIPPGMEHEYTQDFRVEKPELWDPDSPRMYSVRNIITLGDEAVDEEETHFGIRAIAFDADRGFLLNDDKVIIKGVCLHHDAGCMGAAVPKRVLERRLRLLKEMGCNGIRMSHNPPSPEMLDLCDEIGFLVMEEAFDEWRIAKEKSGDARFGYHRYFDACALDDLAGMVRRDRNHPSIVLWSIGNEIPEQVHPSGAGLARDLAALCHREDPSRPVTSACDNIHAEPAETTEAFLDALDVVGYNYVDRWKGRAESLYAEDHGKHPNRKLMGSENVSVGGVRGEYLRERKEEGPWWKPYHARMIAAEQLWRFTRTYPYVAGDFMWTGFDYLGESRWPRRSAASGVFDTCGFPKDGFSFYQSQWTDRPMLHLFPHWNWRGREGAVIPVLCYTNCDGVELFLNGKSFGEKSCRFPRQGMTGYFPHFDEPPIDVTTSDLHLFWDVPYEPGCLTAVGTIKGKSVCERRQVTTGDPARIDILPDRTVIRADGTDISHLTVRVVDGEGITVPTADNLIGFEVSGKGTLVGVDNGNPESHESFKGNLMRAFNGLCLAIVQSTQSPGRIPIEARSQGLASGVVHVDAVS